MSVPEHLICCDPRVFDHGLPEKLDSLRKGERITATGRGNGPSTFSQPSNSESDFNGLDKRAYNDALEQLLSQATRDYGSCIVLCFVEILNQEKNVVSNEPLVGDEIFWPQVKMRVRARIYLT